ncbi:MAG: ABC-F family ATP-binding cassette domain-containing protein [Clostridia bacterium]|nr:ABC-F family ATP-binding cassette domain-containing protein [Clostridia bacterium]
MSILEIRNLTHRFDDRFLFKDANLQINNGEHLGIVGLNGAGKSTFINILAGKLSQDEGEVLKSGNIRWGYLDQHATLDPSLKVMDYLMQAFNYLHEKNARLESLYAKMAEETNDDKLEELINKSARLQDELTDAGYYDLDSFIKRVANGLGVNKFGYDAIIGTLSGGERAKLMLSKLLLEELDVMLLDEPTNFLDVEHVDWLIKYLVGYKKTFMVISHDTKFLNHICKGVISIENGMIRKFSGNYEQYLVQREILAKQYEDEYKRQQAEIKKLQDYIDKNKARAATAGMANSRKKMLDRIEVMEKPITITEAEFNFPYISLNAKEFLSVENLQIGYNNKPLLPPINFKMNSQTKLWIRGTNGVGKTTLIKTLMGKIPSLGGRFRFHLESRPAYLEQDLVFPNPDACASTYYGATYPQLNVKTQRANLAKVGIKGDLAIKPLKNLSGGEQVRVKLAVMSQISSNVLILDEPTNHLDIVAKRALAKALQEYEGAIILVSHEEDFALSVCQEVFDVKNK